MLPREELPQIPRDKIVEFCKFCQRNGVDIEIQDIPTKNVIPIQKHLNRSKLKDMINGELETPLLISDENYIIDGHHRWAAELIKNPLGATPCIKFMCPIDKAVELGHKFYGSKTKTVNELRV